MMGKLAGLGIAANLERSALRDRAGRVCNRFLESRDGNIAVLSGLALPIMIGFAGLAVEVNYWYLEKRKMQEAVDSAAIAAAYEYRNDTSVTQANMDLAATNAITKSGFASPTLVDVNQPPSSGLFAPGASLADPAAVEVILSDTYSTQFASIFGLDTIDVSVRAVAVEGGTEGKACVLALSSCLNPAEGLQVEGSLNLQMVDCSAHANDSCGNGIDINGNPTVTGDCLGTGGLVSGSTNNLTLACGSEPEAQASDVMDPFKDVQLPDVSTEPCQDLNGVTVEAYRPRSMFARLFGIGSAHAAPPGGGPPGGGPPVTNKQFSPGRYCGDMNFGNGTNTFEPGVYFIEGNFNENGSTFDGNDVILVYTNADSTFDFQGNGDLNLTAPSAQEIKDNNDPLASPTDDVNGDGIADNAFEFISDTQADKWAGLVIYNASTQGVGDGNSCANKINGTSDINAVGAIYFPNTCLVFNGNNKTAGNGLCLQVIGGSLSLSGSSGFDTTRCDPSYNISTYSTMIGLVE